jgi:hypothetical protein
MNSGYSESEIREMSDDEFIKRCKTAIHLDSINSRFNPHTDRAVSMFFDEAKRRHEGKPNGERNLYAVAYYQLKRELGL